MRKKPNRKNLFFKKSRKGIVPVMGVTKHIIKPVKIDVIPTPHGRFGERILPVATALPTSLIAVDVVLPLLCRILRINKFF
jgi:hypothetical protein